MKIYFTFILCAVVYSRESLAETWSCAINDSADGVRIQQYYRKGNVLRDLSAAKLLQKWPVNVEQLGWVEYKILLDDNAAIIAEFDATGKNSASGQIEIYTKNI